MGKYTLSVIKAVVGGWVGHSDVHPDLLAKADERLAEGKRSGLLVDYYRSKVGDDIVPIMTHQKGPDNEEIHKFCWHTFVAATDVAKELSQYGAGQDLLADAFSGNVKGVGPGCAEVGSNVRSGELVIGSIPRAASDGGDDLSQGPPFPSGNEGPRSFGLAVMPVLGMMLAPDGAQQALWVVATSLGIIVAGCTIARPAWRVAMALRDACRKVKEHEDALARVEDKTARLSRQLERLEAERSRAGRTREEGSWGARVWRRRARR